MMENFVTFTLFCCITLLFFHEGESLRCRSGNQETDAQFQKVLKTCKNRYAHMNEDSTSTDEDSDSESDSSSEEDLYDKSTYYKQDDRTSYNQSMNNQRYRNSDKNSNGNTYSRDGNMREISENMKRIRKSSDRDSWRSRDSYSNNGNMHFNNNTDQNCVIQCFFNELNAVDQKGFPEKDLVIPLMTKNIQDPELKDFVEQSIKECFQYLESKKQGICEYSQNLLNCLAEKGQQNCQDWES